MADMDIRPPSGSRKNKRIAGRGNAARRGRKVGKGDKGQNSRSGGGVRPGFEGGQMPLYRRIPRKGFSNYRFRRDYEIINVSTLDKKFSDGETVSLATLTEKRVIKKSSSRVKILGEGELKKKLTVAIAAVSAQAKEKIEKAGGAVTDAEAGLHDEVAPSGDGKPGAEKAAENASAAREDASAKTAAKTEKAPVEAAENASAATEDASAKTAAETDAVTADAAAETEDASAENPEEDSETVNKGSVDGE